MPKFTLFTGTYNSIGVINRVFESLTNQTLKDFEWIVVDDCSKDDTLKVVREFADKNSWLNCQIIAHKRNTGVAVSRLEALERANGEFFVSWDHDDIQSPDQLETFAEAWDSDESKSVAHIFAKLVDQKGNLVGSLFPSDRYKSDYFSVYSSHLVGGSRAQGKVIEHHVCARVSAYREVLEYYKKHEILKDELVPNGSDVWGMLAFLGYQTIFLNKPLRTYFVNEEGRESMTSVGRLNNPRRVFIQKYLWVNYFDTKLKSNIRRDFYWQFRHVFALTFYGLASGYSGRRIVANVNRNSKRILVILMLLFAHFALYREKKNK